MLPLWGRVRVDDFLSIGARTLLAAGNLPALDREATLLVYTTHQDWRYLSAHPVGQALAKVARLHPIFFELDETVSKHIVMNRGHRIMLEAASVARALAVPIFADSVFAAGDLSRLIKLATGAPRRLVMTVGFRMAHEAFLTSLEEVENDTKTVVVKDNGKSVALDILPRHLVRLALKYRHSQMVCWSAERPAYGHDILGGPQWDVGDSGVVTHSIYWEPALIDFSFPWEHDSFPVEEWTIDGHYAWVNAGDDLKAYYAVSDSDEFFHVTLARETGPLAYHFEPRAMEGSLVDVMRRARAHRTTDPLRQMLYEVRFRVHAKDLGDSWRPMETLADRAVAESRVPVRRSFHLTSYEAPRLVGSTERVAVWYYEGLYYAVLNELGALNLENAEHRALAGVTVHCTEEEARLSIYPRYAAPMGQPKPEIWSPKMMLPPVLVGTVGATNIVRFENQFYAVPQMLGPIDLDDPLHRSRPGIRVFKSEVEARAVAR